MVRPFTLRDLALVRRLSEQGISLHAESALADSLNPLRGALANMVVGGSSPTLVFKSDKRQEAGFIQLLLEEDRHHAHILYLSPSMSPAPDEQEAHEAMGDVENSAWLPLLDQAVVEVGRRGVHSLVAEVDESGSALPILRRAGFAVYTRQDIWLFAGQIEPLKGEESSIRLLPYLSSDDWEIQLLYANTAPRLVQLVEPLPPTMSGKGWVLRDDRNELAAFIHVHDGSAATWLRFFIHPNVETEANEIVKAMLKVVLEKGGKPLYCCVRRYEGWLPAVLEEIGFRMWGSQAVLVKHTVKHTPRKEPQLMVNVENSGMPATSPFTNHFPIEGKKEETIANQE